jgi:uncharacterized protein YecE (DUF72 family)
VTSPAPASQQQLLLIGCSGWNYGDPVEKGGWVGSFYPDSQTRRLRYYSEYFTTAEFDAIFYEKFYAKMGKGTFYGMVKATSDNNNNNFQFSVKVPETITHVKRLRINKDGDSSSNAMTAFEEFLDRIAPLKAANKLGAILFQLPPSFTVSEFRQVEGFLDRLPTTKGYDYAIEFRHPSWQTEGPWELLKHYNIAAVMTDSPDPGLQYLSDINLTADHAFIRLHGRNQGGYWYNYLYSKEQLKPWADKVKEIRRKDPEVKRLRIYFNNHYGGKAVENALEFKEMVAEEDNKPLSKKEQEAKQRISKALAELAATNTSSSEPQQQKLM